VRCERAVGDQRVADRALRLVSGSGAAFLYADCLKRRDLARLLAPYLTSVRRFGCATVYEVDRRALP